MSDFVGFFCLAAIWWSGVAFGYFICLIKMRGRPHLTFEKPKEVANETTDITPTA